MESGVRIGPWARLGIGLGVVLACLAAGAQETAPTEPEVAAAAIESPVGNEAVAEQASPEPLSVPAEPGTESAVIEAWRGPAESFEARVDQTRRAALEVGAWNLDPAARALIRGATAGTPTERAQGAVRLAPDLPAAHIALARALWIHEDQPMHAVREAVAALRAIGHHTEASLWFAGSGLFVLSVALVGTGLLVILLAGVASAPHAAHDVGHLLRVPVPLFAGAAGLFAALLLPLAFGEGVVGMACVLLAIGMFYGSGGRRVVLALAALALFAGLHPLSRLAADALAAFPSDPVARAAYSTAHGMASPVDLARLEAAADEDPLALRGLAIHARQTGNLSRADALYQRLIAEQPDDLALINNAANVRLDLGHVKSALDLYDRASALAASPVVLFNLSQAYGRSFQVDDLNRALAEAQLANGELVADFTALQRTKNENFVVDFPLPTQLMWERVLENGGGAALAAEFRSHVAPGPLFASMQNTGAVLGLLVGLVWLVATRFEPSGWCGRCGRRQCGRCGQASASGLCESCTRLFYQPEKTDKALRAERVEALRARERRVRRLSAAGSLLIPGAAGFLARRPLVGFLGALCFALTTAAVVWRGGVVPDPLVAGAAAPLAFLGTAVVAGFLYIALVATSLASMRES